MSSIVDNIILAIISLKQELETYLDNNGWKDLYHIKISGDESIRRNEGSRVSNNTRLKFPLLEIEAGNVRNEVQELGDEYGVDLVTVTVMLRTMDSNQLITMGNLIRRKMNDLVFNIKDYTTVSGTILGQATLSNVLFDNLSDPNANELSERYIGLIYSTMELTAQNLL